MQTDQLDLFSVYSNPLFSDLAPHIVKTFWEFHQQNLHVFDLYKKFTNDVRRAGRTRYGIGSITERIRWHIATETNDPDFKINNNYRSCYARLLIMDDPSLAGFFSTRESSRAA